MDLIAVFRIHIQIPAFWEKADADPAFKMNVDPDLGKKQAKRQQILSNNYTI
jgi:hypothetical protein